MLIKVIHEVELLLQIVLNMELIDTICSLEKLRTWADCNLSPKLNPNCTKFIVLAGVTASTLSQWQASYRAFLTL